MSATDKQFYDTQNTAIESIKSTVNHYNEGVIETDTAMLQIQGTLNRLEQAVKKIVEGAKQ